MPRLRIAALCATALGIALLCGCTQAQRQLQAMRTTQQQAGAELKACASALYNSPEYAPLRAHWPYSVHDATLQQLSDPSLATPNEAQALLSTHPRLAACREAFIASLAQSEPALVPIRRAFSDKLDNDLLALTQRRISWGEYIHRWRDRASEAEAALKAADRHVVSEFRWQDAAERERAAALFESLSESGASLQATGNAMLSRSRPTLSSPPSPPIGADSSGLSDPYAVQHGDINPPRPNYCQPGSPFNHTNACPF
jgi:hypothetical protein